MEVTAAEYEASLELLKKIANRDKGDTDEKKRFSKDLHRIMRRSEKLYSDIESTLLQQKPVPNHRQTLFFREYQFWYSEASEFIRNALPSRLEEFAILYKGEPKRGPVSARNYCISDWLFGITPYRRQEETERCNEIMLNKFRAQIQILGSAKVRFESALLDIENIMQEANRKPEKRSPKGSFSDNDLNIAQAMANVYLDIAIPALKSGYKEDIT